MGYSYYANSADVISADVVAKVAPAAFRAFRAAVVAIAEKYDRDPEKIIAVIGQQEDRGDDDYDESEPASEDIRISVMPTLAALRKAFDEATGGVRLWLGHVEEDAMRGSDLCDTTIWFISDHMQPTPAYKKFITAHGQADSCKWITGG